MATNWSEAKNGGGKRQVIQEKRPSSKVNIVDRSLLSYCVLTCCQPSEYETVPSRVGKFLK